MTIPWAVVVRPLVRFFGNKDMTLPQTASVRVTSGDLKLWPQQNTPSRSSTRKPLCVMGMWYPVAAEVEPPTGKYAPFDLGIFLPNGRLQLRSVGGGGGALLGVPSRALPACQSQEISALAVLLDFVGSTVGVGYLISLKPDLAYGTSFPFFVL